MIAKAVLIDSYAAAYEQYAKDTSQGGDDFFAVVRSIYNNLLEDYLFECQRRGIDMKGDGPETKDALIQDLMELEERAQGKAKSKSHKASGQQNVLSAAILNAEILLLPENDFGDNPVERDRGSQKFYCFLVLNTMSLDLDQIATLKHVLYTTESRMNQYEALLCELHFEGDVGPSEREQLGWVQTVMRFKALDAVAGFYSDRWSVKNSLINRVKRHLYKKQIGLIDLKLNSHPAPIVLSPEQASALRIRLESSVSQGVAEFSLEEEVISGIEACPLTLNSQMQKEMLGCLIDAGHIDNKYSENTYFLSCAVSGATRSLPVIVSPLSSG